MPKRFKIMHWISRGGDGTYYNQRGWIYTHRAHCGDRDSGSAGRHDDTDDLELSQRLEGQGFDSELERIQASVDAFYSAPDNARFLGKRQFPVIGRAQTDSATLTQQTTPIGNIVDDRSPFDAVNSTTSTALWNPVGGTVGLATSTVWTNGGTGGIRTIGSNGTGSADVWATVSVVRGGVTYYTDPRYFLIDFEALLSKNILSEIPQAASPDNKPQGSTRTYSRVVRMVRRRQRPSSGFLHRPPVNDRPCRGGVPLIAVKRYEGASAQGWFRLTRCRLRAAKPVQ